MMAVTDIIGFSFFIILAGLPVRLSLVTLDRSILSILFFSVSHHTLPSKGRTINPCGNNNNNNNNNTKYIPVDRFSSGAPSLAYHLARKVLPLAGGDRQNCAFEGAFSRPFTLAGVQLAPLLLVSIWYMVAHCTSLVRS